MDPQQAAAPLRLLLLSAGRDLACCLLAVAVPWWASNCVSPDNCMALCGPSTAWPLLHSAHLLHWVHLDAHPSPCHADRCTGLRGRPGSCRSAGCRASSAPLCQASSAGRRALLWWAHTLQCACCTFNLAGSAHEVTQTDPAPHPGVPPKSLCWGHRKWLYSSGNFGATKAQTCGRVSPFQRWRHVTTYGCCSPTSMHLAQLAPCMAQPGIQAPLPASLSDSFAM